MCLETITQLDPKNKVGIWYKVVNKKVVKPRGKKKYETRYKAFYRGTKFEIDKCYETKSQEKIRSCDDRPNRLYYKTGFHFYTLPAARNMIWRTRDDGDEVALLKCVVMDITTVGRDHYGRACVADKFIPVAEIEVK